RSSRFSYFRVNEPSTSAIDTLPLHDALPICFDVAAMAAAIAAFAWPAGPASPFPEAPPWEAAGDEGCTQCHFDGPPIRSSDALADRKSTRLNSSHVKISYAVFCLKKKKQETK